MTLGPVETGPDGAVGSSVTSGPETDGVLLVGPVGVDDGPLVDGLLTDGVLLPGEEAGVSGTVMFGRLAPWLRFCGLLLTGCCVGALGAMLSSLGPPFGLGGAEVPCPSRHQGLQQRSLLLLLVRLSQVWRQVLEGV